MICRYGGGSVMLWAVLLILGLDKFPLIKESMNSALYQKMLKWHALHSTLNTRLLFYILIEKSME